MACSCSPLFYVFLRKNWLHIKYNLLSLAIITLGFFAVLWGYSHWTNKSAIIAMEEFEPKDDESLKRNFPANENNFIYYAPITDNSRSFMDMLANELEIPNDRFREYNNSEEMQEDMEQQCKDICFGIIFKKLPDPSSNGAFEYGISSNQMRLSPKKRFVNDDEVNHQKGYDEYMRSDLLTLQLYMDRIYMRYQHINDNYKLLINSMPNLEVDSSDSYHLFYFGLLFSLLNNVLLLSTFVVPLVEEKQNGLKEFLNIVTPMSFLNGLTFSIIRFLWYAGFLIITVTMAWTYNALGLGGFVYIFILYMLYLVSIMSYAYLLSVCFHSVFYAKIGGLVLLIIPYVFSFVKNWLSQLAYSFLCTNTFLEGLDVLQTYTNKHRQFTSSDLFHVIKDDASRLFTVYFVLVLQTLLYALLYNYLVCVFPGPGGLKRSVLFFLKPETYKKRQRNEYTTSPRGTHAIIVEDLCKEFNTNRRKVTIADHLSMNINNKEITVLLGHNGAGKTTTMNMIMGIVPKDSGKIVVCSERDVASYRHLIGFCPQHSVFMSYMTCKQHLEFFAELRGESRKDAVRWTAETLAKLNLTEKAQEFGKNLSGGMKRRLSLGIAIAGNTKIVILDEPSSGLDIDSRRELWDILLTLRKEKAILVTTHYMEEAEVLGDTICILANGKLQANGSTLELKRKLGSGYRLKLEVNDSKYQEKQTIDIIKNYMPTAYIQSIVKPTINVCLPYDYQLQFHDMLRSLEDNMENLGIDTISITDTSLETVFLNCAGEADQVDTPDARPRNDDPLLTMPYKRLENHAPHWWQLWNAIFYKKFTFLYAEWKYAACMFGLPLICVLGVIMVMHNSSWVTNEESLLLNLKQQGKGIIYIYNPTGHHAELENKMRLFIEKSGLIVQSLTLRGNNNVNEELIQLQRESLSEFLDVTIGLIDMYSSGSVTADTPTLTIDYASNRYHSSVMLLNMVSNCLLQLSQPDKTIDASYVPIKRYLSDVSSARLEYYVVFVSTSMFFCVFYFISLPYRENVSGFRQLQPMSRYTYWMATISFDIFLLITLCLAIFVLQHLIMTAELYKTSDLQLIVVSIFFYCCSYLPILYALGNSFKSISTISTYLLLMFIISQIAPLITSGNIMAMKQHSTKIAFLCLLPDFNLNHQLRIINENFISRNRKSMSTSGTSTLVLESTGAFFGYAIFVLIAVMGFFVIVLEEKYYRQRLRKMFEVKSCKKSCSASSICPGLPLDCLDDCKREEERAVELLKAGNQDAHDYSLIVSNLRKSYAGKAAVDGISFAAHRGECFGLLGVNGAGKTSTFQMIAANLIIDSGRVQIDGIDIRQNEVGYRQHFGYCPQYDALNKFMTAEQCLRYMALIRGLNSAHVDSSSGVEANVKFWLEKMHLEKYKHVQVRNYSGGTKRKLLAAMAMIGAPSLVLLDEPTTGVDPISRRFLWHCIKDFQSKDRTIVLSSHSMDECEELCNRLAIMAHGKFKCLNNICALKRLSGFTIKLKMRIDTETDENIIIITNTLKGQFQNLDLRESHAGTLTYFIKSEEYIHWSHVFKVTELYLADQLGYLVEYYSVNECTLEDIFLKFEKSKSPPTGTAPLIDAA